MTSFSQYVSKNWMSLPRHSNEFINGIKSFLDFAYSVGTPQGEEIQCPCAKCCNIHWYRKHIVYDHLICHGFVEGYIRWVNHGETVTGMDVDSDTNDNVNSHDDLDGLLHDRFRDVAQAEGVHEGLNEDAKKFYNLVEEASKELYPGCKGFSTLSFTIRLYLLKCMHGWSNASFTSLLELLKEAIPDLNIPSSFNKAKAMVKDLGLDYKKIDACPNDCMLYWKEHEKDTSCRECGASRWIEHPIVDNEFVPSTKPHNVSTKTLRHFPLIPRLQRLFMCSKTADTLRWHDEGRCKDGKLRHPADGKSWKDFDNFHPDFAADSRNLRLGLASDGFNPFRTMSTSHSTWPVILMVYNMPPWMCMKPEHYMLSLLIPGPRSPGNDIDIYLQPLIEELKELWELGVETYDASRNQVFQMRAALLWTISDFPAYAMLSGWSTKGKLACPCCNYGTCSTYLKYSRKMCYMDHRVFLPDDHPWRANKRSFNGKSEHRSPPPLLTGTKVFDHLENFDNAFGKNKRKSMDGPWKKRSIFFSLPYWQHNTTRHNLEIDASQEQKRKTIFPSMSLDEFLKKRGIYVEEEQLASRENSYMSEDDMDIDEDELGLFNCDGYQQAMETDHIEGTSRNKKTRGKTTCKKIHARTMEEREVVTFDKGQAVGPTAKRVNDLTNFLGTIGRNSHFISLSYTNWHAVTDKRRIWKYVNTKFIIPEEGKKWVMEGIRDAWKRYKSAIKKNHFDRYNNIEDMLKNRPTDISENQFKKLIAYWSLPEIQSISRANSESRKKQKWRHKMGPINFGRVRVELRENSENKEEPTQSDVFIATRMGRKGKELDLETQAVIAKLKERQDAGETAEDAFQAVFGTEKPGRVRCYGRSITKTSLKKDGEINKIKQQHAEEVLSLKTELHETREEVQELRNLMKIYLQQNNPGLNIDEALMHAKQCSSHVSNND